MILGEWAIKMTVNALGVVNGVAQAQTSIGNLGSMVRTTAATIGTGLNTAINSISRINLGAQTQQLANLASGIAGVVAAVGTGGTVAIAGAVAGIAASMISMASASMDAIGLQSRLGRTLGINATEAGGLQVLMARSGVSLEEFEGAIDKWPNRIGMINQELARGGGVMVDTLQGMGINARAFVSASLPEQLALMADATKNMSAFDREMALDPIIGNRIGNRLAGLLRLPAEELRNTVGIAEDFGLAIDQSTATGIAATLKRLKEIGVYVGATFNIIGRSFAMVLAPVALHVGTTLEGIVRSCKPILELIGFGLATAFGTLLLPVLAISAAFRFMTPVFEVIGIAIDIIRTSIVRTATTVWAAMQPVIAVFSELISAFMPGPVLDWQGIVVSVAEAVGKVIRGVGGAFLAVTQIVVGSMRAIANAMLLLPRKIVSDETRRGLESFIERLDSVQSSVDTARRSLELNAKESATGTDGAAGTVAAQIGPTTAQLAEINRVFREIENRTAGIGQNASVTALMTNNATLEQMLRAVGLMETERNRQADQDIMQRVERLHEEVDTIGMAADAAERLRFAQRGASQEMQNQLYAAQQAHHLATVRHEMEQRVRQTIERNRSPLEQFNDGWTNLLEMQNDAGDRFDRTQQAREAGRLLEQLERSFQNTIREAPAALTQGSREAAQAIAAARREAMGRRDDPQERMRELMEQAERRAVRQEERDRRALELMENGLIGRLGG